MNTPIKFELAKLLKQKGFPQPKNTFEANNLGLAFNWYNEDGIYNANFKLESTITAPTIAEVVMWLYEKHGIWIEIIETDLFNKFFFQIKRKDNTRLKNGDFISPTEAYEAAIKYTLNKLI